METNVINCIISSACSIIKQKIIFVLGEHGDFVERVIVMRSHHFPVWMYKNGKTKTIYSGMFHIGECQVIHQV